MIIKIAKKKMKVFKVLLVFVMIISLFNLLVKNTSASVPTSIISMYNFNGNYTDLLNGSSLVYNDSRFTNDSMGFGNNSAAGIDPSYWTWSSSSNPGGGFYIDIPENISSSYSIALRFSYDDISSTWDKIIDYNNMVGDTGFYFYDGKLQFYNVAEEGNPNPTGNTTISANEIVDLVVTRDKNNNAFNAYIVKSRGNAVREVYFMLTILLLQN